jgi:hypothetical protein
MTRKLTAGKHVRAPPRRNVVPTESHSDGQNAAYFLRTLRTLLLALGYSEPPLFIATPRLLHGNSYLWRVRVVIYERPATDHIRRIRQVVVASTPRWTFEVGMREAAQQLWLFCDMKRMSEWRIHSTDTSRAELKELKSWCCLLEIATALGASPTK